MVDVAPHLVVGEPPQAEAALDDGLERGVFRRLELRREVFLADEQDGERGPAVASDGSGQLDQARDLGRDVASEPLRFLDDQKRAGLGGVSLREEALRAREERLALDVGPAIGIADRLEELRGVAAWIIDPSDRHTIRPQERPQRIREDRLACADLARQDERAGAAQHGGAQIGEDVPIRPGEPGDERVRDEVER